MNLVTKWKKKYFFFSLDHGVVNVVTKWKKTFFCLDHDVVNIVTKWKKKSFFSLDYGVVNIVTKWKKTFFSLDHGIVNVATNEKYFFSPLDHSLVKVVTKWKKVLFFLIMTITTHFHARHDTKSTTVFIMWDWEGSSKFCLLTVMWHIINGKHIFLYPECDRKGMSKPKKDKYQH